MLRIYSYIGEGKAQQNAYICFHFLCSYSICPSFFTAKKFHTLCIGVSIDKLIPILMFKN